LRQLLIIALVGSPSISMAQSPTVLTPMLQRVLNNFAHENISCAAYFAVASTCLKVSFPDDTQTQEATVKAFSTALDRGRDATRESGLKMETLGARLDLEVADIQNLISNNCSNFSLMLQKYAAQCKLLLETPKKRMDVLYETEGNRQ